MRLVRCLECNTIQRIRSIRVSLTEWSVNTRVLRLVASTLTDPCYGGCHLSANGRPPTVKGEPSFKQSPPLLGRVPLVSQWRSPPLLGGVPVVSQWRSPPLLGGVPLVSQWRSPPLLGGVPSVSVPWGVLHYFPPSPTRGGVPPVLSLPP